jgi:hypothetical protein
LRIAAQNDQRQHELTLRSVDHRHELGLRGLDVTRAAPQPVSFWSTTQGRLLLVALGMAAIQLLIGLLRRRSRGAELLRGVQRGAGQGLVDAAFGGDNGDWD